MNSAAETHREGARRLAAPAIRDGFEPESLHEYRGADGVPIYWRIRAKHKDGRKWIRPMMLNGHGYELGEPYFAAGKKPLYNLDMIAADSLSTVWIVEGEKAADALTKIRKAARTNVVETSTDGTVNSTATDTLKVVATTSGGAGSAQHADWSPLRGRRCVIWPDNDEPGKAYAKEVASILSNMNCNVFYVDVDKLELPDKADAWDWTDLHADATLDHLQRLPLLTGTPSASCPPVSSAAPQWPAALHEAALHGIAGDFVRLVEPDTEADPAGLLVQFLVAFGALVGRGPHYRVEGAEHHVNAFAVLVGATSRGRKGTSWSRVRMIFERVPGWKDHVNGLVSGEGLKFNVRDPREELKKNKGGEWVTEIVDMGISDKRLLVQESEFASVLRVAERPGNTLSATLREAWDSGNLRTLTKTDPIVATGAHVCIVGHITADELRTDLTATDKANGFANRFLFVAVQRSKELPFGGADPDEDAYLDMATRLQRFAEVARTRDRIAMTADARTIWRDVYSTLSAGGDGMHGAVTARAEAQCIRVALLYALLDGADAIDTAHLRAALAVWEYCDATARYVFGSSLGDRLADDIMRRLLAASDAGLTRTDISAALGRNVPADRIGAALDLLARRGMAICDRVSTGGRPVETWRASR